MEMEKLVKQRDSAQARTNEVTERMKDAEHQAEQRVKELEKKTSELVTTDDKIVILIWMSISLKANHDVMSILGRKERISRLDEPFISLYCQAGLLNPLISWILLRIPSYSIRRESFVPNQILLIESNSNKDWLMGKTIYL